MVQKTNGSAIASLVLSILGLFGIGSLLGIIFGHRARQEIRASGGYQGGDGLATAGIVIGWVTLVLFALALAFWIWAFTVIHSDINRRLRNRTGSISAKRTSGPSTIAVDAYQAQKGSFPDPTAPWSAETYASNYGPLTTGSSGGPYLNASSVDRGLRRRVRLQRQRLGRSAQHLRSLFRRDQSLEANPNACADAVSG